MSVLKKLTEGIVERSLQREGAALLEKWERTGLLEGLDGDSRRQGMARLLENQASQLLKEASTMASGDVEGFASVAFPIVRRVFGGLLANELVSVQPMSLPSGLIFFLDFTLTNSKLSAAATGMDLGDSLFGGGIVGSQLTGGVTDLMETGGGFYNLANSYAMPTGSIILAIASSAASAAHAAQTDDSIDTVNTAQSPFGGVEKTIAQIKASEPLRAAVRYDPDLLNSTTTDEVVACVIKLTKANADLVNWNALHMFDLVGADASDTALSESAVVLRRLTHLGARDSTTGAIITGTSDPGAASVAVTMYLSGAALTAAGQDANLNSVAGRRLIVPLADVFAAASAVGAVVGAPDWPLELADNAAGTAASATEGEKDFIPEIDIKVDSIAVTAVTKKLKAKWTPELGQDLNAYHNLDAEVELTQILSEQIALELDREILKDLIEGAKASTYYWSRSPGLFVNRLTGAELGATAAAPDFTGTVSEWYETLVETINDVSAQIHRKTLRGGANFLVTSPEVANILEFTSGFRASVTADTDRGSVGAVNAGSISKKWDVWVDPYFPRNLVLVGRRGSSFLESGYVYAPYVPLQVTPTIFGTEDFVPRKGVMTRYAKQMVRPDMYGLVVVRGLLGESGAS